MEGKIVDTASLKCTLNVLWIEANPKSLKLSAFGPRQFTTAKDGVVSSIPHFSQRVECTLNDVIVAGEDEIRIRYSLHGLRIIAAKIALRTDIDPNYVHECRSMDVMGEYIGFHSHQEFEMHALDLLSIKEIWIHACNYESEAEYQLARPSIATRVLAHHPERIEQSGGDKGNRMRRIQQDLYVCLSMINLCVGIFGGNT